jgi:hypothetical protein
VAVLGEMRLAAFLLCFFAITKGYSDYGNSFPIVQDKQYAKFCTLSLRQKCAP